MYQTEDNRPIVPLGPASAIIIGCVIAIAGMVFGIPLIILGVLVIAAGIYRSAHYLIEAGAAHKYHTLLVLLLGAWVAIVSVFWTLWLRTAQLVAREDPALDGQIDTLRTFVWPLLAAGIALLIVIAWILLRMSRQARASRLLGIPHAN